MNVTCPECRSMFRVDPSKVSSAGVRARCSVCGGVITIGAGTSIDEDFEGGRPADSEVGNPAPQSIEAPRGVPTPVQPGTPVSSPAAASSPTSVRLPTPIAAPAGVATPTPAEARIVESPAGFASATSAPSPAKASEPTPPSPARQTPPIQQPGAVRPPLFARAPLTPPASVPGIQRSAGGASVLPPVPPARSPLPSRPSGVGPLAAVRPSAPPPPAAVPPAPAFRETPPAQPTGAAARPAARTPINPFLANDPNAKARRLSRALVSDLVTYFPQRRDEGLRDGTLKDLFQDEIKKSYEEYIDQVGREFADSTTHFQDALNEILAGGRKVF